MPRKSKDLHLNEIDWAMPRLSPGSRLAVEEVWVESDFTKPPDYLRLAKSQEELSLKILTTHSIPSRHIYKTFRHSTSCFFSGSKHRNAQPPDHFKNSQNDILQVNAIPYLLQFLCCIIFMLLFYSHFTKLDFFLSFNPLIFYILHSLSMFIPPIFLDLTLARLTLHLNVMSFLSICVDFLLILFFVYFFFSFTFS